jgi:hypothetical protein
MPADFNSEPPAEDLFEDTESTPSTPADSELLNSLIIVVGDPEDNAQE